MKINSFQNRIGYHQKPSFAANPSHQAKQVDSVVIKYYPGTKKIYSQIRNFFRKGVKMQSYTEFFPDGSKIKKLKEYSPKYFKGTSPARLTVKTYQGNLLVSVEKGSYHQTSVPGEVTSKIVSTRFEPDGRTPMESIRKVRKVGMPEEVTSVNFKNGVPVEQTQGGNTYIRWESLYA